MRIIIFFNISKFENLHEIKLWNTSISKQFKSLLTENSESLDPKWSTFNTHRKKEEKTFSSTSCLLWLLLISWNLEPWNLCLLSPPIGLSIPWMPLPLPTYSSSMVWGQEHWLGTRHLSFIAVLLFLHYVAQIRLLFQMKNQYLRLAIFLLYIWI